jgi:hypothetical protein
MIIVVEPALVAGGSPWKRRRVEALAMKSGGSNKTAVAGEFLYSNMT